MRTVSPWLVSALAALASTAALATTSSGVAASPLGGNGHNVTFDGRVFVVTQGNGWNLRVLRPERIDTSGAFPDLQAGAFSDPALIQPMEQCENALSLCEANAADTPYACDEAGNRGGSFACYDLRVFDSDACGVNPNVLRFRDLKIWVVSPNTGDARYHKHAWSGARTPLANVDGDQLRGIETTVTRDGKLMVWQGHPDNDGKIDILMYATNITSCGTTGWDGPHDLSHMVNDPNASAYRLSERVLRAADGTTFDDVRTLGGFVIRDADKFRGAYPWLFPDGDAISFTAVNLPCRAENDPAGCGPRRGGLSVIGYPTNWGLGHIDGPVNPATDDQVRLFFSSPGPSTFTQIPVTPGLDVWPFFGSNTSNYTELVFDDGLDGNYAGVWHLNESVNKDGNLDRTRTPDTSGYFNTGIVENAVFPARNEGPLGKTLVFNGTSSRVRVPNDISLDPVNGLTVEMTLRPDAAVDCDGNNNFRVLLDKGGVGVGAYSLVLEEGQGLQARVKAGGEQRTISANSSLPVGQWSSVAFSYQASTGLMSFRVNGVETNTAQYAPALLDGFAADLRIGSPGTDRASCPDGNGAFFGQIEEVRLSRVDRFHTEPVVGEGEGEGEGDTGGEGEGEGDTGGEGEGEGDTGGEGEGEGEGDTGSEGEGEGPGANDDAQPPASCAAVPVAEMGMAFFAVLFVLAAHRRAWRTGQRR